MRNAGGNQFIGPDPTRADFIAAVQHGLDTLDAWAEHTGRTLDLVAITVDTRRIPSGVVSVSVTGDLLCATTEATA